MIKHIFKNIFRNILKDKVFSLINLGNIVVGFTAFILLSLIVYHEFNWDKYQENYSRIYRVQTRQEDSHPTNYCTYSPAAYRYRLMEDLPEVEKVLLMHEMQGQYLSSGNEKQVYDTKGYWSEHNVFEIFTYRFLEGDKNNALADPNTIVLSKEMAGKIFPGGKAVGKMVILGKHVSLRVDGVYADLPKSSGIRPSFLVSLRTYETLSGRADFRNNWTYIDNDNIVLLKKGADPRSVDAKIKYAFKDVRNYEKSFPYLHPVSKWHTAPNSQPDLIIGLSILSLAAFLILLLSCVNYINLTLANSTRRALEIGIKKVVGFSKRAVAVQFIAETMVLTFVAAVVGIALAQICTPLLSKIVQRELEINLFDDFRLPLLIIGVSLVAGFLSGCYPSFVLASYNPVKVLKGKLFSSKAKKVSLKKVLVVLQFSISLFMLIASLIFFNHVNFMLNKSLGFPKENLIFTEIDASQKVSFATLKERLVQHPEIVDATFSSTIPFNGNIGGYTSWDGAMPNEKVMISRNYINYDFIPTFGLQVIKGRNFSKDYPADCNAAIINETAAKAFGWDDPIGKNIDFSGRKIPVVGLVKDFHAFSVHNPIPTYIMFLRADTLSGASFITVRFAPGTETKAKQLVKTELENLMPNDPFEFKDFQLNITADFAITFWQTMKRIFEFFAIVTIFIASIGLFGLILFTTKRRVKEIGVRKILGSSVSEIFGQLSGEVMGLLVFAMLFACPAAYLLYKTMPGAYKEPIQIWGFLISAITIALIAFLTICYHVLKVARSNPSEALRYE
jgi:putative ABC transport system permease protein